VELGLKDCSTKLRTAKGKVIGKVYVERGAAKGFKKFLVSRNGQKSLHFCR
jgi:hypothetical protein